MIVIDKDSDGNVQVTDGGVTETLFPNIDETGGGGSSSSPSPSSATPKPLGTASAGSSTDYSRADHVHAMPTAENVGAIAAPSSPSSGQFLQWNGSAWAAASLPTYNGGVS